VADRRPGGERTVEGVERLVVEEHESDLLDRRQIGERGRHRVDRDRRGPLEREAIDARGDRRKRDAPTPQLGRELERASIAGAKKRILAPAAAVPDRPDRVDDVPGVEVARARCLGLPGPAAAERDALGENVRTACAVNGTVDAAPAAQRFVRRIDDGIDLLERNIPSREEDPSIGVRDQPPTPSREVCKISPARPITTPMNRMSSRWTLLLLTILVIALSIALARMGHPPNTGMWDGPR
jgi:hypothetical protein